MGRVKTEQLDIAVDALLLDEENPRLGSAASQSETLRKLVDLNSNHFRNLMLSIKENGLDPGDSFYVIEHEEDEGDYIVLDGNRRLSALQVLHNPSLLDGGGVGDKTKKRLRKAAEGFDPDEFEDPRCVCFESRDEANEWIYRRHTGGANGEGRIDWGPLEIARFTNDRSVLDLLAFVGRNADLTDDEWEDKRAFIESKQSSNIERLLTSSAGKQHLGLKHIVASDTNEFSSTDLRPFQSQLLTSKAEASLQSLNSFVHSNYAIPTADSLRSAWEACLPVYIATYGEP